MQASDQNRAGAAIALGAAFLGAGQAPVQPEEIQKCLRGTDVLERHIAAIQNEANLITVLHLVPFNRSDHNLIQKTVAQAIGPKKRRIRKILSTDR